MSTTPTRISCSIDLEKPGRQVGYLGVSHSDNAHAYGIIPVPIVCIRNGYGPTVLITAGNHGDEHEGPLIVRRLLNSLDTSSVSGCIIMMPALNYPAVLADTRVSPIDAGNMNRAYPGSAEGTPTFSIAHFVESVLLPKCDAALDLHSGGKASEFLPCAFLVRSGSRELMAAKLAAVEAFGAPTVTVVGGTADTRSLSAAADRHNVINMATELSGGGTVSLDALEIGNAGTLRWLAHHRVIKPEGLPGGSTSRFLRTRDRRDFVMATMDGVFEPAVRLGDSVVAGQTAGVIYSVDNPEHPGETLSFNNWGVVMCRRVPARAQRGDYLFHLGDPVEPSSLLDDLE
jgi:predicted deacylase